MNLIFEGPDNVGKGTTITNIRNHYNDTAWTNIFYTGVKTKDTYGYMADLFGSMWKHFKLDDVLSDRSHISEYVFAKRYRKMSEKNLSMLFLQEKYYKGPKTVLIMLIDTPLNLVDREDGFSHSETVEEKQEEMRLYLEAYGLSKLPKFIVDVNNKTPEQVKDYIIKQLDNLENLDNLEGSK